MTSFLCGINEPQTLYSSFVMRKIILSSLAAAALAVVNVNGQLIADDNGSNYSGGWTDGSNGGFGFEAWVLGSGGGTGGFGGSFIGDPAGSGISGMATNSFGLFANPSGSGAFSTASRALSNALVVGETLSFQWGINFDSGAGGNKGFNLYTGGTAGTSLLNVNNGGSSDITLDGTSVGFGYGTNAMTWSFTLSDPTTLAVSATARDGGAAFSTNLTVSGAPDAFQFYASDMQAGGEAQPYFNSLQVVPEPSTYALLTLGALALGGYAARRRARK